MTYKDIINRLDNLATDHLFINTFGYGDISDISVPDNEEPPNYPYMFVNPISFDTDRQTSTFNFNLIMMTQVNDTEDDEITGQSRCANYIEDIISVFTNTNEFTDADAQTPYSITFFKERYQDDVVGATANITLQFASPIDGCNRPFDEFQASRATTEDWVLVIDGDGRDYQVNVGNTFTCLDATPRSGIFYVDVNTNQNAEPRNDYGVEGFTTWYHQQGILPTPEQTQNALVYQAIAEDNSYDTSQNAFNLLKYNNVFGNKYRFTNDAGNKGSTVSGYSRPQFHYLNDWAGATHGIVIDNLTGLMYTAYSQSPPNGTQDTSTISHGGYTYQYERYSFPDHINYCHGLNGETQFNLGGYTDWRLPTFSELLSLYRGESGFQFGYPGTGPSPYFSEVQMYDWYITKGETGNPPRNAGNVPSTSNWGTTAVNILAGYFFAQRLLTTMFCGMYCRVWRG